MFFDLRSEAFSLKDPIAARLKPRSFKTRARVAPAR
jgi:hypothetical protein